MISYEFEPQNQNLSYFQASTFPQIAQVSKTHDEHNWFVPSHIHDDQVEIVYVEHGIAYYSVDTRPIEVLAGQILIIDPGTIISVTTKDTMPTTYWVLRATNFQFPNTKPNGLLEQGQNYSLLEIETYIPFVVSMFQFFKNGYEHGITQSSDAYQYGLASLLTLLYEKQKQKNTESTEKHPRPDPFLQNMIRYIDKHFASPITLQSLADHFNASSSYISHLFSQVFGISPINHVIDKRICNAKWMLISTLDSVEKIAENVGYNNTYYFQKLFAQRIGCSPADYRKLYSENSFFHNYKTAKSSISSEKEEALLE
ncbi:MAG: helix-turn-helix transcriptional regulator [Eubacterium sp.]|nr:helix-turn-helix transcriptional regulator [Eubacterium sp.]